MTILKKWFLSTTYNAKISVENSCVNYALFSMTDSEYSNTTYKKNTLVDI